MKDAVQILAVLGLLLGGYALFAFDISVPTEKFGRVVNLALMEERRLMLIGAGVMIIVAAIMYKKVEKQ